MSLSVGAEEFPPEAVPSGGAPDGKGSESYRDYIPPRDVTAEVFGPNVLTPAIAGAAPPAVFAGAVAPANLARTDVPAIAGMEFSASLLGR